MGRQKGEDLENAAESFFKKLFEEMGFFVVEARKQFAGTQNGFDIKIVFIDDDGNERNFFFECKNYETTLDWSQILEKVVQLEAASYTVDGFIALSPKIRISNINDNVLASIKGKFKFPIKFWTPDNNVEELFSFDPVIYERIYNSTCTLGDVDNIKTKYRLIINNIIGEKRTLHYLSRISIPETDTEVVEEPQLITSLDVKLNAIFDINDPERIEFHRMRCDYKIYLESLVDRDNSLRSKIISWQKNLRIKAKRLTRKFQNNNDYKPINFFDDFFDEAENELLTFFRNEQLDGDKEKLLHGVVFELAAECPLDWRRNNE